MPKIRIEVISRQQTEIEVTGKYPFEAECIARQLMNEVATLDPSVVSFEVTAVPDTQ